MTRSQTVSHQTPSFSEKKHKPVLRTLRSALWAIGLAGVNLAPATVWADGATQTQMAKTYNIAPGPLGSALLSFADQAGVNLSMDMSVTKGLMTQRSEEHTSELQSLMRISYAVFCLKKKIRNTHARTAIIRCYLEIYSHVQT